MTTDDIIHFVSKRFWSHVNIGDSDSCWPWTGSTNPTGYGLAIIPCTGSKRMAAHRLAYIYANGGVSDSLVIDHLCRNRICCNPSHLEAVTTRENILRGSAPPAAHARKTHCIRGHEFTDENTIRNGKGRKCRLCHNDLHRRRYREKKV